MKGAITCHGHYTSIIGIIFSNFSQLFIFTNKKIFGLILKTRDKNAMKFNFKSCEAIFLSPCYSDVKFLVPKDLTFLSSISL